MVREFRVVSTVKLSNNRYTCNNRTHRVNPCVSYLCSVFAFVLLIPLRWDSKPTQASPRHPRRRSQQRLRGHHRPRRHEMRRHKMRRHKMRRHKMRRHKMRRHKMRRHKLHRHKLHRHALRHRKLHRHALRHRKLHHYNLRRSKLRRQPMISIWMRIEVLTLATPTILHTRGRRTPRVRLLPTRSFAVRHLR